MAKSKEPIAIELAKKQKQVSVAEFFERNRHLLGFDNKRKSLLTVIKEAVDNSLDACEEAQILPEISIEIIEMDNDRYRVIIEDNGPGIVKKQVPSIFAKLLYGSKFHTLKQARGQQGIGISASVLYAQLTTGRPAKIKTKIGVGRLAYSCNLRIDTINNKPELRNESESEWKKDHGTRIELDIEGAYQKGDQSVDTYLKQTAIVNPHATIIYTNPKAEQIIFPRATDKLPKEAKEIKPHPYGLELGILMKMARSTDSRTLQRFLTKDFSRVGNGTAKEICQKANLLPTAKPNKLVIQDIERLMKGIKETKIIAPPSDCIAPIGADLLEKGLKKEVNAEFYTAISRTPSVYRGNPFVIEVAIAYGGDQKADGSIKLMRYANRVPLLYQQRAGAAYKAATATSWRSYGLSQSSNQLPQGPVTVVIHLASVWPPFTSEAKEAIASYPEIIKDMKLAIQEAGRQLGSYVNKKKRLQQEVEKRSYIKKYMKPVANALKQLLDLSGQEEENITQLLGGILEDTRGEIKNIKHENTEYDAEFAKIGQEDKKANEESENKEEDEQ